MDNNINNNNNNHNDQEMKYDENDQDPVQDDAVQEDPVQEDAVQEDAVQEDAVQEDNQTQQIEETEVYLQEIFESIEIARETYLFSYDDYLNTTERNILKFVYQQLANIYTTRSLINLLSHMKYYYNINFPENNNIFNLFFLSVYPQAVMTDRMTMGVVQVNPNNNSEINNTFVGISGIIDNIINPNNGYVIYNDMSSNPIQNNYFNASNSSNPYASLFDELESLSRIFNISNNTGILNVLNLMNNIINENPEKQVSSESDIKILETLDFVDINKEILEKNSNYCTICQENYEEENKQVKLLPCGHFFHCTCIEPWLLNCSNLCPICRVKI
jgi:hypothetical protein